MPGSQTASWLTSANGAPGAGIAVNVGRGAKVDDATGARAVCANDVVGVIASLVDCVSVEIDSSVGVTVAGVLITFEVGMLTNGVLKKGRLVD